MTLQKNNSSNTEKSVDGVHVSTVSGFPKEAETESPTPIFKQTELASAVNGTSQILAASSAKFPHNLPHKLQFILSQNGIAYLVVQ